MTGKEREFTNTVADIVRVAYDEGALNTAAYCNIMWRLADGFTEKYGLDFDVRAFITRCQTAPIHDHVTTWGGACCNNGGEWEPCHCTCHS